MLPLWIPVTFTAALFQTWRTALQQRLRGVLSVNAAGFVRYIYAIPVGLTFLSLWLLVTQGTLPAVNWRFLLACAAGGLLQIFGTTLLIMAFGFRNFAVGTAYAKTEAVQGAIIALIILGEVLSPTSWSGIGLSVVGVLVLSLGGHNLRLSELLRATVQPAALCGLSSGFVFAFTSICIKLANQALPQDDLIRNALFGLVVTNIMQTVMQGGWLMWREPQQLRLAFTTWRSSAWVGALSACGSACWFTAFALAPVAMVRALGQVEMVFTLMFSRFYLKETLRRVDIVGLVLIICGVILVLLGR